MDSTTDKQSIDIGDAVNELLNGPRNEDRNRGNNTHGNTGPSNSDKEMKEDDEDATSIMPPSGECSWPKNGSTSRRKSITKDLSEIKLMMGEWMEMTCTAAISEVTQKLFPYSNFSSSTPLMTISLAAIPGFSIDDIMQATHHLANNKGDFEAFWGMPEDVRGRYVIALIEAKY